MEYPCQGRPFYRVAPDKSSRARLSVDARALMTLLASFANGDQFVAGLALVTNFANSAHGNVRPPWIGAIV